jgi:uncharacterized protein (DUF433 family)
MKIAYRIEADPGKCGGKACIRSTRIRVLDVLELLASGASIDEILEDYPTLEREDFAAALNYAASQLSRPVVLPLLEEAVVAHAAE